MTGKRIGKLLQTRREAQGLTQEDLAKRAKVARSYLAKLEAGHSKNPSLAVLQRLAKALGVRVTALLE
jgi:transcriptional regulator with XRE-family HTH domain